MRRAFCAAALATALLGGSAAAQVQVFPAVPPIGGGIGRPGLPVAPAFTGPPAQQRAVNSQLVVSGTVSQEKDALELEQYKGSPVKTTYKVFNLKVTDTIIGDKAEKVKILVGPGDFAQIPFEQPGQPAQPYYPAYLGNVQLMDGQEGVFFLMKHPAGGDQWIISNTVGACVPLNPLDTTYKADLATVKAVAAVYADPVKALKTEKLDDKIKAAVVLMTKYSRPPAFDGRPHTRVAISDDETKLIFAAMMEADWGVWDNPQPGVQLDYTLNPANLLGQMQVYQGAKGAANFPQVQPKPGQGYNAAYKETFKAWREGAGKDFQIMRYAQPGEKVSEPKKDEPKKPFDPKLEDPKKPDVIRPDIKR